MSVKIKNKRVLLKKLEGDIAMTLAKYEGQELDETKTNSMSSAVANILHQVTDKFDAEMFEFTLHRDKDSFTMEPNNFISALWLRGIDVSPDDISGDHYEDNIAVYQWEDGKLAVTPKSRVDLI